MISIVATKQISFVKLCVIYYEVNKMFEKLKEIKTGLDSILAMCFTIFKTKRLFRGLQGRFMTKSPKY